MYCLQVKRLKREKESRLQSSGGFLLVSSKIERTLGFLIHMVSQVLGSICFFSNGIWVFVLFRLVPEKLL